MSPCIILKAMKIEIFILEDIQEKCTGMTCFEASKTVSEAIQKHSAIQGIIIIDCIACKFKFYPFSMDGDIFTDHDEHRHIIKHLIPLYVYNKVKEDSRML